MKYLKLETCQLLEKLGCTSENDHFYTCSFDHGKEVWTPIYSYIYGQRKYKHVQVIFTWDDICTNKNASKIWPKETTIDHLLISKLNGKDWEAELLKYLTNTQEVQQ